MSRRGGLGGTGRFPRIYGEGGSWGKQGFPHGSEPKASDGHAAWAGSGSRARRQDSFATSRTPARKRPGSSRSSSQSGPLSPSRKAAFAATSASRQLPAATVTSDHGDM